MSIPPIVRWLVAFADFPLGASLANLVIGPVDTPAAAAVGGAITGAVLGAAQGWALFGDVRRAGYWAAATAAGLGAGLAIGATVVDFRTGVADLAVQGAISGVAVGAAQAGVLVGRTGRWAALWPAWLAGCWSLGWVVTASIGVEVDDQFTVFGSSGAITVTLLTAMLPAALGAARTSLRQTRS